MKRLWIALMIMFGLTASAAAQTPSFYNLKDSAGASYHVRDFLCATGAMICPASVSTDTNGNALSSGAGTSNPGGSAMAMQGITGGVPFAALMTDGVNGNAAIKPANTPSAATDPAVAVDPRPNSAATLSGASTNPSSTYTLTSTTTAYTAGQLIANNATAGSITNPSFTIANSSGGAAINRLRLSTNDTVSTAWAGQTIQVDLWTATPTWTNGDRGTWLPATGSASHLGTFSCLFPSPVWGDGSATECSISVGNFSGVKLASGSTIYWSMKATTGSGVTGASKVFTLIAELIN